MHRRASFCHPEQREGSRLRFFTSLRCAQNDRTENWKIQSLTAGQ